MKTDICMVVENDVRHDGRVMKEAASLAAHGWNVLVIGISTSDPAPPDEEVLAGFTVRLVKPRLLRRQLTGRYGRAARQLIGYALAARQMRRVRARVYHAHDFSGLLALALAGLWRRAFVYDAHELYFDRNLREAMTPTKRLFSRLRPLEKSLARRAAAVVTVGDQVAAYLARALDIPLPLVVRNVVDLRALQPAVAFERPTRRLVAHSGGVTPGRHLPELVAAFAYLPDDVSLALIGDGSLRPSLVSQAEGLGLGSRLVCVYPVNPHNIPTTLAQADAACILITSGAPNYALSLPNKLFEAIAAGLPIVASPIPEVQALVERFGLGVTCDPTDPAAIAGAIQTVLKSENYERFRANAARAREELNWEREEKKLLALYQRLLDKQS